MTLSEIDSLTDAEAVAAVSALTMRQWEPTTAAGGARLLFLNARILMLTAWNDGRWYVLRPDGQPNIAKGTSVNISTAKAEASRAMLRWIREEQL